MRYIPSLDGIRGLAILLVIGYHYWGSLPGFSLGWSGVDIFFVLSGYLITGRLSATVGRPHYFRTFYRNRILRIFPLYFATLILFFTGIHFLARSSTQLLADYHPYWIGYFLFFSNWTFIIHGLPTASYLSHLWSLSVEEQFYLFWPAVILWLRRKKPIPILAWLILAVIALRCTFFYSGLKPAGDLFFYDNTFLRMDSFIIGALLYYLHLDAAPLPLSIFSTTFGASFLVLITAIVTITPPDMRQPFFETIGYSVIAIFSACLIHGVVRYPGSVLAKVFANPALRFVGRISYGMYIFHWPVLLILDSKFSDSHLHPFPGKEFPSSLFSPLLCLLITFGISVLSYHFFESPFLRLKSADTGRPRTV